MAENSINEVCMESIEGYVRECCACPFVHILSHQWALLICHLPARPIPTPRRILAGWALGFYCRFCFHCRHLCMWLYFPQIKLTWPFVACQADDPLHENHSCQIRVRLSCRRISHLLVMSQRPIIRFHLLRVPDSAASLWSNHLSCIISRKMTHAIDSRVSM